MNLSSDNIGGSNLLFEKYGYRDIQDKDRGLAFGKSDKQIVVRDNLVFCDTRDCVGEQSIKDTQAAFQLNGGGAFTQNISSVTGLGVGPIVISSIGDVTSAELKNGDRVVISGVQGNTAANGVWKISNFTVGSPSTFELSGSVGNGLCWRRCLYSS